MLMQLANMNPTLPHNSVSMTAAPRNTAEKTIITLLYLEREMQGCEEKREMQRCEEKREMQGRQEKREMHRREEERERDLDQAMRGMLLFDGFTCFPHLSTALWPMAANTKHSLTPFTARNITYTQ